MAPRAVLPTGFHVEEEEGVGPQQVAGPGETQGGTVGHHQTIPQPPATLTQHSSGVLARSQHFLLQTEGDTKLKHPTQTHGRD